LECEAAKEAREEEIGDGEEENDEDERLSVACDNDRRFIIPGNGLGAEEGRGGGTENVEEEEEEEETDEEGLVERRVKRELAPAIEAAEEF
jgi:hypothetical protein